MTVNELSGHTLLTFPTLSSTSDLLREQDLPSGTVVRALTQSAGRGRRGNGFSSAAGGLYFSIKLPLTMPGEQMWAVTFMTANAVCDAIEKQGGFPAIKWVNDVYLGERKVCGILCEVMTDALIVGVGINVKKTPFPPELAETAVSLEEEGIAVSPEELLGEVIRLLDRYIEEWDLPDTLHKYRKRSMLIGREITYTENGERKGARVTGIADNGNLLCQRDGESFALHSGEVHTVRADGK